MPKSVLYVTKYALTKGIFTVEIDPNETFDTNKEYFEIGYEAFLRYDEALENARRRQADFKKSQLN